jgi:hypothetical protein
MNQSAFHFSPRTPQQGKTREFSSQTDRAEGRSDSFLLKGRRRHFYFFCFLTLKPLETRMVVRKTGNRVGRFFPIFAMFLPRVGLILPIVVFFGIAPLSLFLFQITEEREEKRGQKEGKAQSQSFFSVVKNIPIFGTPETIVLMDCFLSKSQHWRGFAGCQVIVQEFFLGNAYGWPLQALSWRGYGLCALD